MKNIYLLIIIILMTTNSKAQSFNYIDDHCFGTSYIDQGYAITRLSQLNVIIGNSNSKNPENDKSEFSCDTSMSPKDFWILAFDDSLNKIWDKTYGGTFEEKGFNIISYRNGFVISGQTSSDSSCSLQTTKKGIRDYILIFLDSLGNKVNELRFGSIRDNEGCLLDKTLDGGLLLTGISNGVHSFDKSQNAFYHPFGNPYMAAYDYWVIKLDSLGVKQWDKVFGGYDNECDYESRKQYGLTVLKDTNYLIYGVSQSGIGGNITSSMYGAWDALVFKVDKNGNKIWDKRFGGSAFSGGTANSGTSSITKIVEQNNCYYMFGYTSATIGGTIVNQGFGSTDLWLIKTDTSGNLIWEKKFGTNGIDVSWDLIANPQGGLFALGEISTASNGTFLNSSYGSEDIVVMSIDTLGSLLTYKIIGENHRDFPNSLIMVNDSTLLISATADDGISNVKNDAGHGAADIWAVKVGYSTTTTSLNQLQNNLSLTVRPNPAKDQIAISGLPPASYVLQTYNIDGRLVMSDMVTSDLSLPLSIETLQSGMYITNIKNDKISTTVRWVKE
ncbi:MAG: T9SS type A sorting domain-containing protein [Bacteroidota bacterium]